MPERTADLRRIVELIERLRLGAPVVAVVGHDSVWRDDLVAVLSERVPTAATAAWDEVPEGADLAVGLELSGEEAGFQRLQREWERDGRRAGGDALGAWSAVAPDDSGSGLPPSSVPHPDVDVVFVPVSGVRPPRRIRFFYGWDDGVLWDDDIAHLDELVDLLPMSAGLRRRITAWAETAAATATDGSLDRPDEERDWARLEAVRLTLSVELDEALGSDFVVS